MSDKPTVGRIAFGPPEFCTSPRGWFMDYERLQAKCRTQEKEIERLRSEVRAMTELLIDLHASGVLSEGQVAKATGLDRVQIRALADGEVAEGYETEKDNA